MRDVGRDLRAGVVSRALDVLRQNGAVREHGTHEEADAALVRSWAEATRAGKSALLVASRNDDTRAMNGHAREAVRERLGDERTYAGDSASQPLRSLIRSSAVNAGKAGSTANATRSSPIYNGRLELRRERDGVAILWDLHEHRAIDHGYATTSYRSQGRTVGAVFALDSSADARRGLHVDVTRAREDVTIAYRKDECATSVIS